MTRQPPSCPPVFATIYTENFRYVWQLLSRYGVRSADLEDLVQDVFLTAHRRLPTFDTERPIRPWLGGIAYRVALAEHRRFRSRYEDIGTVPVQVAPDVSPEKRLMLKQQYARVRTALGTLDFDKRAIFVMHDMEGMSGPDVADALGLPLNTVYSRLRRARRRFNQTLDRLGRKDGEI